MNNQDSQNPRIDPALLTATEIQWLLGTKEVNGSYSRKMRSVINKKLQTFYSLEAPLLAKHGFNVTIGSNAATANGNAQEAKTAQSEGSVNLAIIERENSPRRDSDPRPKVYETFALPG